MKLNSLVFFSGCQQESVDLWGYESVNLMTRMLNGVVVSLLLACVLCIPGEETTAYDRNGDLRNYETGDTSKCMCSSDRDGDLRKYETGGTSESSSDNLNAWEVVNQDFVVSVKPRVGHATAPFRIQTINGPDSKDSKLLLVIHGGFSFLSSHEKLFDNTTDFFDIDTGAWISPDVETGNVTDLGVAFHTATSFPDLPGSPVVIFGGQVDDDPNETYTRCVGNVRILQSELDTTESQNRLIWREGQSGPPRCYHAAVALGSRMVVFGGVSSFPKRFGLQNDGQYVVDPQGLTNDIFVYSPIENTWTMRKHASGISPVPRFLASGAVAINDHCMIIVRGTGRMFGVSVELAEVDLYNMSSNRWTRLPDLPTSDDSLFFYKEISITFYIDSDIRKLVTIGCRKLEKTVYLVYQFNLSGNPADGEWKSVDIRDPAPLERLFSSLTTVNYKGLNRAYLFGGLLNKIGNSVIPLNVESIEMAANLWYLQGVSDGYFWTKVSPLSQTPDKVYAHTMTLLGNSVLLLGGYLNDKSAGRSAKSLDAWRISDKRKLRGNWEQYHSLMGNMYHSIYAHTSVPADVRGQMKCIVVYGGQMTMDYFINERSDGVFFLVCPQLFVWKAFKNIADPVPPTRMFHTAVVYESQVYVFGGLNTGSTIKKISEHVLDDVWCLNVSSVLRQSSTDRLVAWKQQIKTTYRPQARFGHTAVLINNNTEMIVFGGTDGQTVFDDVWTYRFRSNEWKNLDTSTPSVSVLKSQESVGRFGHIAVITEKYLIVYGGCTSSPQRHFQSLFFPYETLCREGGFSQLALYLDIRENKWGVLETKNSEPLLYHRAVLVGKEIIVYGGKKPDSFASDRLLVLQPSCNPGMHGSLFDMGCDYCPVGTYSAESGPLCTPCNTFFTTSQTGSRSEDDCNICYGICGNGGSCIVKRPNYLYECHCLPLFTGPTCANVGPVLGLASGIIGGIILLYLIFRLVKYFYRVKRDAQTIRERDVYIGDFIEGGRIDESELTFRWSLGEGAFGEVILATYREIEVAVKILHQGPNRPIMGSDTSQLFEQEIDFMRRTRHRNIVLFLGWGVTGTGGLFLVTEYMQRGSLSNVLQTYRTTFFLDRKLKFARDAADGMRFLHAKGRIHRDLKTVNLLVDRNWMVKVGDFGSARTLCNLETSNSSTNQKFDSDGSDEDSCDNEETVMLKTNFSSMTARVGTLLYSAPEILFRQAYGAAIDVYSFGIVMWEIYVCRAPYDGQELPEHYDEFLEMICARHVRPAIPANCPEQWRILMTQCWSGNSHERPLFREIVDRIDDMIAQM
jgi:N-acetylneuraminic acid mutarotase